VLPGDNFGSFTNCRLKFKNYYAILKIVNYFEGGNKMPISITIIIFAFYAVIFAACLLEALFPKWCWKTFESWKAAEEPSEAYFFRNRVVGMIGMVVITVIALVPILIAYFDR